MAIKAFTRKTSGPTTSDEFLKDYENLLKRNKGGGLFMGYDTSSQTPIYMGTSVADPTGLGSINPLNLDNSVSDDYSTINPSFVDLSTLTPEELIQFYTNPQVDEQTKAIIEQLVPELSDTTQLNQNNEDLNETTQVYDTINQDLQAIEEENSPTSETNILKRSYSTSVNPTAQRYTGDAAITDEQIARLSPENQAIMRVVRDNARYLQDAPQEIEAIRKANEEQRQKESAVRNTVTGNINQTYAQMTGQTQEQLQKNLETGRQASRYENIPEGYELNPEGTGIVRKKEDDGMGNAVSELLSFIGNKTGEGVKNVRGAVGDTIDSLAYAIPGSDKREDTGFSEWVAGRPTPHTVSAAEQQSGSGLTRLRDDMSYSPTALAGRPDFSQIGLKRSIGNVAGIQDQSAITGNKEISQDGQSVAGVSRFNQAVDPISTTLPQFDVQQEERPRRSFGEGDLNSIVDAMMSRGYNNRAEAEAVAKGDLNRFGNEYMPSGGSSGGSNNSNNSNNNQQSSPTSNYQANLAKTYTAPTTSNNSVNLSNLSKIGTPSFVMPTVGVGSNQPQTSNSNNSNSLMSTISNLLANLFRRK